MLSSLRLWQAANKTPPSLQSARCLSARLGPDRRLRFFSDRVGPGQHQTPIVDKLWNRRKVALEENARKAVDPSQRGTQTPKRREDSEQFVRYKFSNPDRKYLVEQYRNPWGYVRPGRLFEDLDALAGTIAFEHCRVPDCKGKPAHIVTASVDRVKYKRRPDLTKDMLMSGFVSWVGRSSMEIQMQACIEGEAEPFMESVFTFVARDPDTGGPTAMNPLIVSGPEQERLFELGAQRYQARKEKRQRVKKSPVGSTLDQDGFTMAEELLNHATPLLTMPSLANPQDVLLEETRLQNTFLTMPQQRNTAGRIFGGFLMRRAYELARSTAHLFAGRRPIFDELDEVLFRAPVSIGDMVMFDACVLYTSQEVNEHGRATVHTEVQAYVLKPETAETKLSNTFGFTFSLAQNLDGTGGPGKDIPLRRVIPGNRQEAYRIIERYITDMQQVEEDKQAAK